LSSSDNPQFEPQPVVSVELPVEHAPDPLALSTDGSVIVSALPVKPPPIENPVWNGWDVLLIVGLTFAAILVLQFGLVLVDQLLYHPHEAFVNVARSVAEQPFLVIVLQFLTYIPVALLMFLLVEGKYHVPFWRAIEWNWPRSSWMYLGFGAVTLIAVGLLQNLLPIPKDTPFEHLFDRPRDAYLLAIMAVTLAPLLEELFFRGFLYPVVARRWGAGWGVFLAALPFALLHLQQYGYAWGIVVVIFIVGVVCGIVRVATRSVGASFLVHVSYNGIQMIFAIVYTHGFRHMERAAADTVFLR